MRKETDRESERGFEIEASRFRLDEFIFPESPGVRRSFSFQRPLRAIWALARGSHAPARFSPFSLYLAARLSGGWADFCYLRTPIVVIFLQQNRKDVFFFNSVFFFYSLRLSHYFVWLS